MPTPTLLEELAAWAAALRADQVPARLWSAARAQIRSVLAAVYAGAASQVGRRCRAAAVRLASAGRATLLPSGEPASAFAAVLGNAACSMVHDYDDYLFLGHTGHSSVLAALAAAEEMDASLEDLLVAQIAANEVAGRLGAYVAVGPQNGQTWAHIHLAGAAVASARLHGLSAEQTADALALAFYQPPFTLFPGFMGSDGKALTAAVPSALGLYAAGLAADGMRGARGILEHRRGFAAHFSFVPLPEVLGGLGKAWVTDALSCKVYPGCAYVDGPVEAGLAAAGARRLAAADVDRIEIAASALTTGMEALGEEAAPADSLDPIAVTFSARRSLAAALLEGGLGPRQLDPAWLDAHAADVRALAGRTTLREDRAMSMAVLQGIDRAVPLGPLLRSAGPARFWRARDDLVDTYRAATTRSGERSGRSLGQTLRHLFSRATEARPLPSLAALGGLLRAATGGEPFDMAAADFSRLEFRFGAEVTIRLRGGEVSTGRCTIPRGAAGGPIGELDAVSAAKLGQEAAAAGAAGLAAAVEETLARAPAATPARDLARAAVIPGWDVH